MEFIAGCGSSFTKRKRLLQAIDKLMRAWNYIQKASCSHLNIKMIKQAYKIMMQKEKHQDRKDVLVGVYRNSPAFAGLRIFAHKLMVLKDIWKKQFLGPMKLKKMIQSWPTQICLEALSIYIHLKVETEKYVA